MGNTRGAIRAVIFDLDGVLWNSIPVHEESFKQIFERYGIRDLNYAELAGLHTLEAIRRLSVKYKLGFSLEDEKVLVKEKRELAIAMLQESKPVDPGFQAIMEILKPRVKIALASSAGRGGVDLFLEVSKSRTFFDVILTGDDVEKAKPDPEIFIRAIRELRVQPNQSIVVEDSFAGLEAAHKAGAQILFRQTKTKVEDPHFPILGRITDLIEIEGYL